MTQCLRDLSSLTRVVPRPSQWKRRILTSGPPGNSLIYKSSCKYITYKVTSLCHIMEIWMPKAEWFLTPYKKSDSIKYGTGQDDATKCMRLPMFWISREAGHWGAQIHSFQIETLQEINWPHSPIWEDLTRSSFSGSTSSLLPWEAGGVPGTGTSSTSS